jgi:MYXO-CTERM domain-containing protein
MTMRGRAVGGFVGVALAAIVGCGSDATPRMGRLVESASIETQSLSSRPSTGPRTFATCANTGATAFGDGSDGAFTAPTGTSTFPAVATSASGTIGSTILTVASTTGIGANDLVLIDQTQGTTAGNWEIQRVVSTTATTIVLTLPLANAYSNAAPAVAQAIRVAQYTDVTVGSSSTVQAPAWNGETGGFLIFVATGTVSIAGVLSATAAGFRGGLSTLAIGEGGQQGESPTGEGAYAIQANGGGGGGGNLGTGGGGGYGTPGATVPAGAGGSNGAGGAVFGSPDLAEISFGSGGGGAGAQTGVGTGASGGGAVMVAGSSLSISGAVHADGAAATGAAGGAGGAIFMQGRSVTVGTSVLTATGTAVLANGREAAGGNGRIRVTCDTVNGVSCDGDGATFSSPTAAIGSFCTIAPQAPLGVTCGVPGDCTSGFCADGVCCGSACSGQCEACDVPGAIGTCTPVSSGAPHGTRTACVGLGTSCEGTCDGTVSVTACQFPSATTSCGSTCANDAETDSACNGEGTCVAGAPKTCPAGFACGANTCSMTCSSASQCESGYICTTAGVCAPAGAPMCADATTSQNPDGQSTNCGTYLCDPGTGGCKTSCESESDCVSPNVCNSVGQCVAATGSGAGDGSSGGCSASATPPSAPSGGLAVVVAASLALTRRRRRAPTDRV